MRPYSRLNQKRCGWAGTFPGVIAIIPHTIFVYMSLFAFSAYEGFDDLTTLFIFFTPS